MATYLLIWNPRNYRWRSHASTIAKISREGKARDNWSTGNSRRIQEGDRLFLMKVGEEPRGIVGSARAVGQVYQGEHWDGTGRDANYINLEWDALLTSSAVLPLDRLRGRSLEGVHWTPQSSGVAIPPEAAIELERLWARHLATNSTIAPASNRGWAPTEVAETVRDYFDMLKSELAGHQYSKTRHRSALLPLLNGRSQQAIEFKHCNISALLAEQGLPYINGYKPRGNAQRSQLEPAIEAYLSKHPRFFEEVIESPLLNPRETPVRSQLFASTAEVFCDPPEKMVLPVPVSEPWRSRRGRRVDFAARDAQNQRLGRLGEEFAIDQERRRLVEAGRDDLAARVEHVAQTCGDGLGFDVLSFDESDESERLVEVKTTGLGKYFPFYVTACEVRCSESVDDQYHLYRVFDFATRPKIFVLKGSLKSTCRLDPVQYRAVI